MSSLTAATPYNTSNLPIYPPPIIPGCALWLDAADATTIIQSGGNVSQWNDKSGYGRHMVQGVASNQPIIINNTLNKLPVISLSNFSSSNYMSSINTLPVNGLSNMSIYIVANALSNYTIGDSTQTPIIWWNEIGGWGQVGVSFSQSQYGWRFGTGQTANNQKVNFPSNIGTSYVLVDVNKSNLIETPYYNGSILGTSITVSNTTIANTSNVIYLGLGEGNTLGHNNIGEIIIYNQNILDSQRQQVEGYLAWKWGLQNSLPTSHPFYNDPYLPYTLATPYLGFNSLCTILPTMVPGCALWLDAADASTVILSGSKVIQWNDKSGYGNNLSTISGTPTYNSVNGLLLTPTNTGILQSCNYFNITSNTTAFMITRLASVPTNFSYSIVFTDIDSGGGPQNIGDYSIRFTTNGTLIGISGNAQDFGKMNYYVNGTFNPNFTSNVYLSNTIIDAANINGSYGNTRIQLSSAFYSRYMNGYISEVIVYSNALTTNQRQQIEGYLAWKWGLQKNLSASHPAAGPSLPIVRVGTSSYQWQPNTISGLALWLDAADPSTLFKDAAGTTPVTNNSQIQLWKDKSGSNNNASNTQTSILYYSNGINSLPTIFFPGTQTTGFSLSAVKLPNGSSDASYFFVINKNNSPIQVFFTHGSSATNLKQFYASAGLAIDKSGVALISDSVTITNNKIIVSCTETSLTTGVNGWRNGTPFTNNGATTTWNVGTTAAWLGSGGDTGSSYIYGGYISEVIVYNRALTTTQRQQIEGYLAWKWGLQKSLPSSHPYVLLSPG